MNQKEDPDRIIYLKTPYYRTIPNYMESCNDCPKRQDPDFNYSEYDLFCLKTQLVPYLRQNLPHISGLNIKYHQQRDNHRMIQYVILVNGDDTIDLSTLPSDLVHRIQDKINYITSKTPTMILVFQASSVREFPTTWVISVMSALNLPSDIITEMYTENNDGYILTQFGYEDDFNFLTNALRFQIVEQIRSYWQQGLVLGAESIAENWELEIVGDKELIDNSYLKLYKPKWNDTRFAPLLVPFLQEKIRDPDGLVRINLGINGSNGILRHYIAKKLNPMKKIFLFDRCDVKINATTLNEAQIISYRIDTVKEKIREKTVGSVIFSLTNIDDVQRYHDKILSFVNRMNRMEGQEKFEGPVAYRGNDTFKPYVLSIIIPYHVSPEKIYNQIESD